MLPGSVTCAETASACEEWMRCGSQKLNQLQRFKEAMMRGYGGSILRVNLTTGKVTKQATPPDVARDFIGGRGFGAYFLFKEVPQHADP